MVSALPPEGCQAGRREVLSQAHCSSAPHRGGQHAGLDRGVRQKAERKGAIPGNVHPPRHVGRTAAANNPIIPTPPFRRGRDPGGVAWLAWRRSRARWLGSTGSTGPRRAEGVKELALAFQRTFGTHPELAAAIGYIVRTEETCPKPSHIYGVSQREPKASGVGCDTCDYTGFVTRTDRRETLDGVRDVEVAYFCSCHPEGRKL